MSVWRYAAAGVRPTVLVLREHAHAGGGTQQPVERPRLAGLLNLALDEAITSLNDEVAPRHPDLRPAHLQVFRYGSIDGRRTTELAALARMTKQAMHELVTHFERHGYLRREREARPASHAHVIDVAGGAPRNVRVPPA